MKMNTFSIAIDKARVAEMPVVEFSGPIVLVDSEDKLDSALADLNAHSIVGFDTETKPSFKKGCANKVALMQLSTDNCNYLIRLNRIGIPEKLKSFLENESIVKVGLSIHDDFSVMRRSTPLEPKGFVELQHYVRQFCIKDSSLQKIYAIVFGKRISKKQRLTNWEAQELTPQQQAYAALDSWACLHIYRYLSEGKFDAARSPYIVVPETEACDEQQK